MPFTLTMPKLSPTMEEGVIAAWHKKEGDHVEAGDLLFEVATDKATVEYNALDEGWLRKIIVQDGQEAVVNQAVAIFTEQKDESIEGYQPEGIKPEAAKPVPKEASAEGKAAEEAAPKEAPAGASVSAMRQPVFAPEAPLESYRFELPCEGAGGRVRASPYARKLAKEKNLDLSTISGSGPSGTVMSRDLEKAQPSAKIAFGKRKIPQKAPGSYEEDKLSPMRKVIAQRLQEAKTFIPHFYVTMTIDAQPLVQMRDQLASFDQKKITFNDFVIRACALALVDHPVINSGFNTAGPSIVRYTTVDISVAVSLPEGLITPIIRHADCKNLGELSAEMKYLAKKAKEGKLQPEEYKGGSFCISNLGMFGVTEFQAIINPPQSAILAVSGILDVPVVKSGKVVPGKTMNLTLSVDHRVIDGVAASQFLNTLKNYLENPVILVV